LSKQTTNNMKIESKPKQGRRAEIIGGAWHYWEPRRLAYNGALVLVALGWLVFTWPHFRPSFNFHAAGAIVMLAALANICYSAVYLAELAAQLSPVRAAWNRWRFMVWLLGTLFALALEMYWIADEIYPHPTGP
jgi:hypothetical protein